MQSVSYWNVLTFNFAGSWSTVSDYQANLNSGSKSGINAASIMEWYSNNGASPEKLLLGNYLPLLLCYQSESGD